MDRSRADEILRDWTTVADNAQRPSAAPKPHMTRTALPAGLLAAAAIALVAVFVFDLGARSNQPGAGGPSGSASAGPSVLWIVPSTIPSFNLPSPTNGYVANPSPIVVVPTPTEQPSQKTAAVVASMPNCSPHGGWLHAVSGKHLYIVCYGSDQRPVVADVDLTTNAVLGSYITTFTYIDRVEVDGGSLWVGGTLGSACVAPCTGFNHVLRFDIASGKQALDLSDWTLRGDGFGYIWASDKNGGLSKLDPATGAVKGHIAFTYETAQFACGSLWGMHAINPGTSAMSTTLARVSPADGSVLATFSESGKIGELSQIGAECWAPALSNPDPTPGYAATEVPYFNHFDRIGQSSIEFHSPAMPWSQGCAAIFDGTFWLLGNYYIAWLDPATGNLLATMQRIDPATWKPVGAIWTYTGAEPALGIDGALWAGNGRDNPTALERLNVPLGPLSS
jgi:hypothetical protein